jgi:hypothetical protein
MFAFPILYEAHELKSANDIVWQYGRLVTQVFDANFIVRNKVVQIEKQLGFPIVSIAYQSQI